MQVCCAAGSEKISIDREKTSAGLFTLTVMTILPASLLIIQKNTDYQYRNPLLIGAAVCAVPALCGWTLFGVEFYKNVKDKKLHAGVAVYKFF